MPYKEALRYKIKCAKQLISSLYNEPFGHREDKRMISKELLSEILNKEVISYTFVKEYKGIKNFLSITCVYETCTISIYELMCLCKEWIEVISPRGENKIYYFCELQSELIYIDKVNNTYFKRFKAETEPESVFKAGKYILKELK